MVAASAIDCRIPSRTDKTGDVLRSCPAVPSSDSRACEGSARRVAGSSGATKPEFRQTAKTQGSPSVGQSCIDSSSEREWLPTGSDGSPDNSISRRKVNERGDHVSTVDVANIDSDARRFRHASESCNGHGDCLAESIIAIPDDRHA